MHKDILDTGHRAHRWRSVGWALGCWLIWTAAAQHARAGGPDAKLYARTVERAIKYRFAKALDAIGDEVLVDGEGTEHDWRRELVEALAERQAENGSWSNPDARWLEGNPNLCTGFALLALSYCKPGR